MGGCRFKDAWLTDEKYGKWVSRSSSGSKFEARCSWCRVNFSVKSMGIHALASHSQGKKHIEESRKLSKNLSMSVFTTTIPRATTGLTTATGVSADDREPKQRATHGSANTLDSHCSMDSAALSAEIIWAMKCVDSHYSYKSCENISDTFRRMFPDSDIARHFQLGERKCAYLTCFGLAPYCRSYLQDMIRKSTSSYVLLFDESLNKATQSNQMDVHIRYWDEKLNIVCTRYFNSEFLGHSTAEDLLGKLLNSIRSITPDYNKILQLSMDGPSVNWKLYDLLSEELRTNDPSAPGLLNIGSCGLYTVHNAFKGGQVASGFGVSDILKDLHYLLIDCPARREDYAKVTGSSAVYPLKFCKVRWVENIQVVRRAKQIWQDVCNYVSKASDKKEKRINEPSCKSYKNIKAATQDVKMIAKMDFYESVANQMEPFLKIFQTDRPIFPFLTSELEHMLRGLMKRFLKPDVLKSASTQSLKIDMNDDKNCVTFSKVDIGFESEMKHRDLKTKGTISERDAMEFRMSCLTCLKITVSKLMEKTPIAYGLGRSLKCLDPNMMAQDKAGCLEKFKFVQLKLVEKKWLSSNQCDPIKWEFEKFLDEVVTLKKEEFQKFDYRKECNRLDSFLFMHMGSDPAYSKLWGVVKTMLIISHGQASIERGFSVNRQILVENMIEQSFVGQRLVHDYIRSAGGVKNVVIDKQMLLSASQGRSRYNAYLWEEREKRETQQRGEKRKHLHFELAELKKRKTELDLDIKSLHKSAREKADEAESKRKLDLIVQSNTLRHRAEEKESELAGIEEGIHSLEGKINSA